MFTKQNIKVKLFDGSKITLKMKGDYFIGESQRRISGKWDIYISDDKIFLEDEIEIVMSSSDVYLSPVNKEMGGCVFELDQGDSKYSKHLFKGIILLKREGEDVVVVNEVDVESFVASIMCNRFPNNTQIEYLKVQAVALRNSSIILAINQYSERNGSVFEESDYCKILNLRPQHLIKKYTGVSKVCNQLAHDAVKETEGLALVSHDSLSYIPQTLCCGGVTEQVTGLLDRVCDSVQNNNIDLSNNDNIEQWVFSGSDSYCKHEDIAAMDDLVAGSGIDLSQAHRWKRNVEVVYFNSLLRNNFDINVGNFKGVEITERGTSGAVKSISVFGDADEVVLKEGDLDRLIVLLDLPSRSFVVEENLEEEEATLEINGAGMGTAEGICNVGAMAMSVQGKSMKDILDHYLPGFILEKQY
ncbi:SpoIID/LytB domain-containing protein [Saccharicrinis sp. GN24d3]|uniref:SpoIID/LytB domain-containing protein n=1 Tax=Saccharicrinis sp. GN24d3 TaxID=3458416 RepID=UPI0040352238